MRKFWAILFFVLSGLLILIALLSNLRVLFLNGHHYSFKDAGDVGYQLGYLLGSFLLPGILVWIAVFLIKRGNKLMKPKELEVDGEAISTN
jgi:uncharacterized membrane protein